MKRTTLLFFSALFAASSYAAGISNAQKDVIKKLMDDYAAQDKAVAEKAKRNPIKASEFSAETGQMLFMKSRNWEGEEAPACAACHTKDPKQMGTHAKSKKPIKPLAPVANPERFTSEDKVEKNFSKHCREIYNRDCDPAEKGHYLAYLMSVK
ncbi:MAG: DUF1924 domain-containing protein [Sulfuritalea sp.]|nr:DUF1924 domain-containing protein [Sulfuritalea sp.]